MTTVVGIALLTSLATTGVRAQAVQPGDRVRLTLAHERLFKITGQLVEFRGDSMVVQRDDSRATPIVIAADQVQWIERSVGTRTRGMRGAGLGALIGGALGAVVGFAAGDTSPDCPPSSEAFCAFTGLSSLDDRPTTTVFGAAIGAMAGIAVGGLMGLASTTDRWQLLNAPDQPVKLSIKPAGPAGPRAMLSYAFGGASRK